MLYYVMLYYIILYYDVLYDNKLYCIILNIFDYLRDFHFILYIK